MIAGGLPGHMTATVQPGRVRDNLGDLTGDAGEPYDVEGCWFEPDATSEDHNRANTVTTAGTVYAPPGSVFPPTSRVTIDGFTGEVVGDQAAWDDAGVVVRLRSVKG